MAKSSDKAPAAKRSEITAGTVTAYLRRHPDFLAENPDLLDVLTPPARHGGDGVVDIQQVMLERLRAQAQSLKAREKTLIAAAEANAVSHIRVQRSVFALLEARSFDGFVRALRDDVPALLDLEAVVLCVESKAALLGAEDVGVVQLEPGVIDRLLPDDRDCVLRQTTEQDGALLGRAGNRIRSLALIRLDFGTLTPPGLLALGSARADGFHPDQATDLLAFFAGVIERCVRRWLAETP